MMPFSNIIEDTKCTNMKKIINQFDIKNYAILDDFEPNIVDEKLKKKLILVNPDIGIDDYIAADTIKMLVGE